MIPRFLFLLLLLVIAPAQAADIEPPAPLPQTGLITCFDATFAPLSSCQGTGQDGDYRAGLAVPDPRFTFLGDGTAVDKLTGLMWADDANVMSLRDSDFDSDGVVDGAVTWLQAEQYLTKLNQENFAGHSDWRLPTVNELESLIFQADLASAVDYLYDSGDGITGLGDGYHWSRTGLVGEMSDQVWAADFAHGRIWPLNREGLGYVWPVRSDVGVPVAPVPKTAATGDSEAGVAWPALRFQTAGDGSVTDTLTGLVWAADSAVVAGAGRGDGSALTWQAALDFVVRLNAVPLLNKGDWRLPNRKELFSIGVNAEEDTATFLADAGFVLPSGGLPALWSSTTSPGAGDSAWTATFMAGGARIQERSKGSTASVLVVRGGRAGIPRPAVSMSPQTFGVVERDEVSEPAVLTIINEEEAGNDLVVGGITKSGSAPGSFTFAVGGPAPCASLTPVLVPGTSCTLSVTFSPQAAGELSAILEVHVAGGETIPVTVSGTGKDTTLRITPDKVTYLTNQPQQVITGSVDIGATVKVWLGAGEPYVVPVSKSGRWSYEFKNLVYGKNTVTFIALDDAENTKSSQVEVTYQPFIISASAVTVGSELGGGTISPAGDTLVTYRGKQAYAIKAEPGFHVEKVVIDGKKSVGSRSAYTFTNVRANRTIEARFARDRYKISLSAGKGGAITAANGNVTYTKSFYGLYTDTPTITITPKPGWAIKTVLVDGNPETVTVTPFTYTFSPLADKHKVTATFTRLPVQ